MPGARRANPSTGKGRAPADGSEVALVDIEVLALYQKSALVDLAELGFIGTERVGQRSGGST